MVSNILESASVFYLDPIEDFANETLARTNQLRRENKPTSPNPLFNGAVGDGHFSALGCDLWARAVARRLVLLLGDEVGSK